MDLGLEGRPALVAAASRGIGLACATALAREGARVAICSRDRAAVQAAAAGIEEATGRAVVPLLADVAEAAQASRFIREGSEALDGCQILVINAGGPPPGRAQDLSDADWFRALELSFLSAVRMSREAVPLMRGAGYGRIVAIESSSVREPIPGVALSNAARAAAWGFLKTLGREVAADGITVNAILPGRILTDRTYRLVDSLVAERGTSRDEELERYVEDVPMRRLGAPMDVGNLVAYLSSEQAGYITGSAIAVDGGMLRGLP